ncbi:type II toxin-antitoxin system HicB family antitoxin [Brevibacillus sp. SIMBA_040]|uniref:type II toxin-antitoxin system HicB family antitoxin n=1 Tax=unclassified Brevibacillus TaxID=2684853 RepID=UPI0039791958
MERYMFAALFQPDNAQGFTVTFPDLPGCITEGDDFEEAARNAKEALELHLYGMEEEGMPIPKPTSNFSDWINKPVGQFVIITAWMDVIRDEMQNKAVNKTVTMPKWLADEAKNAGINFSQVLQTALKKQLGIGNNPRQNDSTAN